MFPASASNAVLGVGAVGNPGGAGAIKLGGRVWAIDCEKRAVIVAPVCNYVHRAERPPVHQGNAGSLARTSRLRLAASCSRLATCRLRLTPHGLRATAGSAAAVFGFGRLRRGHDDRRQGERTQCSTRRANHGVPSNVMSKDASKPNRSKPPRLVSGIVGCPTFIRQECAMNSP